MPIPYVLRLRYEVAMKGLPPGAALGCSGLALRRLLGRGLGGPKGGTPA